MSKDFGTLLGAAFKDFVLVAADKKQSRHFMVLKHDENKIFQLSENIVIAIAGSPGDSKQFSEYITKNMQLYKMRNGYELSVSAAMNFTRRSMAERLRSSSLYDMAVLIAGFDDATGPQLYSIDCFGSSVKVPFLSTGWGGYLSLSILDQHHNTNMTVQQGFELLKKCLQEVYNRSILDFPSFTVKRIEKDGIMEMPSINCAALVKEKYSSWQQKIIF